MENKQLILIGIIVILASVIIGGGIGLINSNQNPLGNIDVTKSTFTITIFPNGATYTPYPQAIETIIEGFKTAFQPQDLNNDTIKWLESFNNSKYIILQSNEGYLLVERNEYDKLNFNTNGTGAYYTATIKANIIETHTTSGMTINQIKNIKITNITKQN